MVYSTCFGWDLENIRSFNHAGAFIHAKIPPSVLSTKAENMSLKIRCFSGGWGTMCDARKKLQYRLDISIPAACTIFLWHFWVNHSYIRIKFSPPKKCQQRNFGDSTWFFSSPVELCPSSPTNCQWHMGYSKSLPLASTLSNGLVDWNFPPAATTPAAPCVQYGPPWHDCEAPFRRRAVPRATWKASTGFVVRHEQNWLFINLYINLVSGKSLKRFCDSTGNFHHPKTTKQRVR